MLLEQQKPGEIPFAIEVGADEADHRRDLGARRSLLLLNLVELRGNPGIVLGIEPAHQLLLVGVIPIEGADGDAGAFGDHRYRRRVGSALGKELERRSVDPGLEVTFGAVRLHIDG